MSAATSVRPPAFRLCGAASHTYAEHLARLGPLPAVDAAGLVALAEASGLAGRGGAGFPTGRKIAAVAAGGRGVVVANGAEGEPASRKDRLLLQSAPHLVLDGLVTAARALGGSTAHLYGAPDLLDGPVAAALAERSDPVALHLVPAPDTFVAGQETAVVAAVRGGRPVPTDPSPPVRERGVDGRPTLVLNVETLAHLAQVVRFGPAWFRTFGTPDEPGTRLATVSGSVVRPGVYEVAGGAPLAEVVEAAGGFAEPTGALLVGGYHGGWVPTSALAGLAWSRAALAPWGAAPGAGVVVALPAQRCGLEATATIATHLAGESAQQCGPCLNGLPALAAELRTLAEARANRASLHCLQQLTGLVEGRGACAHPDGTVRMVRSALRTFARDVDAHLDGRCLAARPTDQGRSGQGRSGQGRSDQGRSDQGRPDQGRRR